MLAYRELDEALGLKMIVATELADKWTGKNTQHSPIGLLRQSVYIGWLAMMTLMARTVPSV